MSVPITVALSDGKHAEQLSLSRDKNESAFHKTLSRDNGEDINLPPDC